MTVAGALVQELSWLGHRFCVPGDWDIAAHTTDPARGSLSVVDRRKQRLTLSWLRSEREPDLARLVSDWSARERELDPQAAVGEPLRHGSLIVDNIDRR